MNHQVDTQLRQAAREIGLLVMHKGTEYASCVRKDGLEVSFESENPDTEGYIEIIKDIAPYRRVASYNANQLNQMRSEYPQFFDI